MGSVEAYATRSGRRYRVLYRKPDHSQTQRRGFRTKKEAELFLASLELDKARGVYLDASRGRIRLADWLDQWFADRVDLRPTTRDRVGGIIRRDLTPSLGAYPLAEISPSVVQRWIADLSRRLGPASVRKCVHTLSGALDAAVADGRLVLNPARGTKLPKVTKSGKRYLSHEQVDALADAVDRIGGGQQNGGFNGYGDLVRVLAYCGLRWGEVSGLRVMDVDLVRRRLEVRHTVVEVNGLQLESTPKDYETRSVPIPAALADRLKPLLSNRSQEAPVFPSARSRSWLRNRVFREAGSMRRRPRSIWPD
jgi:integrase